MSHERRRDSETADVARRIRENERETARSWLARGTAASSPSRLPLGEDEAA